MRELNSICLNDYEVLNILYQFVRPYKTVQCISAFEQLTLCLMRTPFGSAILDINLLDHIKQSNVFLLLNNSHYA